MPNDDLRATYQELCSSYRAIDEFRLKLLGFLPFASGIGAAFLSSALKDPQEAASTMHLLKPIATFGFVITLGLLFLELYGIRKCHSLIEAGKEIEARLACPGQFIKRPRAVFGFINEPFAAGVIYPAVLALWMYLVLQSGPSGTAFRGAIWVFAVGFVVVVLFQFLLKLDIPWV